MTFVWGDWDYVGGNTFSINYGTRNNSATMNWSEEKYHARHVFEHTLHFWDRRVPVDAVKLNFSHEMIDPFHEPCLREELHHLQPEWLPKILATIGNITGNAYLNSLIFADLECWRTIVNFRKSTMIFRVDFLPKKHQWIKCVNYSGCWIDHY